jgi:hypothetical protein
MNSLPLLPVLVAGGAAALAGGLWLWMRSRRKTPEQMERERRRRIAAIGRITDGTVLDTREVGAQKLLLYHYDVGGVSYEAAQDVTHLADVVDFRHCRVGVAASIKYDPQHPGNSIVVSEEWSGLRLAFGSPHSRTAAPAAP